MFQSLGAECAKLALWETLSDKIFTMVNFVHDEIIAEISDEGPKANTEKAEHLCKIMADAANQVLVDVPIKAEPTLMRRWIKGDCERDADGNIVPLDDK